VLLLGLDESWQVKAVDLSILAEKAAQERAFRLSRWRSYSISGMIGKQDQQSHWASDEYGIGIVISLNFSDGTEKILSEQAASRG
jgi:hypothetical protein